LERVNTGPCMSLHEQDLGKLLDLHARDLGELKDRGLLLWPQECIDALQARIIAMHKTFHNRLGYCL
jgi:hypothetical protein